MTPVRLLHVDDETQFAASLGRRLTKRGLDVTHAASGAEALEIMDKEDEPFEVILLDIKMPGIDGITTLGRIKSTHPMVEVIMLTAHANTDIVISSLGMGAYDYLTKPMEIGEIVRRIENAAERRRRNMDLLTDPVQRSSK